ncbi:MAG TPA: response regulator [Pyrinomonadaceae bacterium]|nr:response regulator [Pyrinomonadaceae bacterium]
MLAGKKLLLADDSITIQKVVDLTFTDEGVTVLTANDGREAIEKLTDFAPDVVLADVFMPQLNGYQVCEHIKQNDQLKHIPVMLLVGSFEPFDEAEARRVGANDTLTKPFQSIRTLLDKVGALVGGRTPDEQIPTKELPHSYEPGPEPEQLTDEELKVTTADTLPLPEDQREVVDYYAARQEQQSNMNSISEATIHDLPAMPAQTAPADELLDLGNVNSGPAVHDDFVLDLDLDEPAEPSPEIPAYTAPAYLHRTRRQNEVSSVATSPTVDPMARTQEFPRFVETPKVEAVAVERHEAPAATQPAISTENIKAELSPEMIDAIAKRAVEQLSEKVVQEIAWEVVPQLAELMIKRQLDEKNS